MSTYQVRNLEEADQIIREHERKTKTSYTLLRSTKNFGRVVILDCANDENEVRFETVGVPYCGAPFYVAGIKILQCQSFKGRGPKRKKELKNEPSSIGIVSGLSLNEDPLQRPKVNKKIKTTGRTHHKLGCTATVIMKEIIYYPEFQMYDHSKNNRIAVARHLKDILKSKGQVQKDRIIYVTVPGPMDHFGHALTSHNAATTIKGNVKRLYVKNDFYGHNEPGNSKRVYYPIKQEKVLPSTKRLKVDEDDSEAKAKEVREVLQSIMALTYKPGTSDAFANLLKDLNESRQKYKESMEALYCANDDPLYVANNTIIPTAVSSSHQAISIETSVKDTVWQRPVGGQSTSTHVIPGRTIVAIPLNVSASSNSNTVTLQPAATSNSIESTSQETSIFLEAMEAIFNPQM